MATALRRVLKRLIEPPIPVKEKKEPEKPKVEEISLPVKPEPKVPEPLSIQVPQEVEAVRPEQEDFDEDEEQEEEDEDEDEEESEEEDEGEEPEDEDEQGEEEAEEEEPAQPEKYTVRKLLKQTLIGKDGRPYIKPVITTLPGGTFEEDAPGQTDIEAMFYPLYGGGDYLIVNQRTGKVYKKIHFDGAEKDPNAESPIPPAPTAPRLQEADVPQQAMTMDRVQLALASGQTKAVEELARLADRFTAEDNAEQLGKVVDALKEIATGKKAESNQDRFMEYIIADKNKTSDMLTTILLESRKSKQPDASDVVRDTLGIVKDMLAVSREIMPGEDQTVALTKEITGAVKEGLKEVTDTVVKVTGSGEFKAPPEASPSRQVFRCGRCGEEVKPHYRQCPNCGLIFRPGALPKVPEAAKTETFEPTGPKPSPPPPIPIEVKARLGYLRKLALFIQENHDPEVKADAIVKVANDAERKQLLFLAEFGYDNLMKMANPYRTSPEIPDREAIYKLVESGNGKLWINRFFKSIRRGCAQLGTVLSEPERTEFIETINKHSSVKFHVRKVQPPVQPTEEVPVTKEAASNLTTCPICDALMDIKDLERHLFTNHPRPGQQRKVPPPVTEPLPQEPLTPEDER